MNFKKLFLLFLVVLPVWLQADFTHVAVWRKLSKDGKDQKLVMCGDFHEIEKVGHNQAQQIAKLLADRACKEDGIIVEDLNDLSGLSKAMTDFLSGQNGADVGSDKRDNVRDYIEQLYQSYEAEREYRAQSGEHSLLFLIPYFAKKSGIDCLNVDFRQLFTSDAPGIPISGGKSESAFICWLLEGVVADIASFNDESDLYMLNKKKVEQFVPFMHYICSVMRSESITYQQLPAYFHSLFLAHPDAYNANQFLAASTDDFLLVHNNLNDIVSRIKSGDKSDALKEALMTMLNYVFELSMVELMDVTILHRIVEMQINADAQNALFVCVGEAHMEAVEKELPLLGYTKIEAVVDEEGVDLEAFCKPHLAHIEINEKGALWLYITDLFDKCIHFLGF